MCRVYCKVGYIGCIILSTCISITALKSRYMSCAKCGSQVQLGVLSPQLCMCRGIFGEQCSLEQVRKELAEYSDFALHAFAAANGKAFATFMLPADHVQDGAKCRFLAHLLPKLKACLHCSCCSMTGNCCDGPSILLV